MGERKKVKALSKQDFSVRFMTAHLSFESSINQGDFRALDTHLNFVLLVVVGSQQQIDCANQAKFLKAIFDAPA